MYVIFTRDRVIGRWTIAMGIQILDDTWREKTKKKCPDLTKLSTNIFVLNTPMSEDSILLS